MTEFHDTLIDAGWVPDPIRRGVYRRCGFSLRYFGSRWYVAVDSATDAADAPRCPEASGASPRDALRPMAQVLCAHGYTDTVQALACEWLSSLHPLPPEHKDLIAKGWEDAYSNVAAYRKGPVTLKLREHGSAAGVDLRPKYDVYEHTGPVRALEALGRALQFAAYESYWVVGGGGGQGAA